jgi:hypothetical protein
LVLKTSLRANGTPLLLSSLAHAAAQPLRLFDSAIGVAQLLQTGSE